MGVVGTAFAQAGQAWGQKRTTPVHAGILYALEPVFAAIFAALLIAERLSAREWIGAGIIFGAVLLVEIAGMGKKSPAAEA